MAETSEEFWDAILQERSYGDLICTLCKRVHFSSNDPGAYDNGELEKLREKAEEDPDNYIEYPDGGVDWGTYNGQQIIYNCCTDKVAHMEQWAWSHRRQLVKYLKSRTKRDLGIAQFEHENIKDLKMQQ